MANTYYGPYIGFGFKLLLVCFKKKGAKGWSGGGVLFYFLSQEFICLSNKRQIDQYKISSISKIKKFLSFNFVIYV